MCYAPVLRMSEAIEHPHNVHRKSFIEIDGVPQPAPAPRFMRTPAEAGMSCAYAGQHSREGLADWGFGDAEIAALESAGALKQR